MTETEQASRMTNRYRNELERVGESAGAARVVPQGIPLRNVAAERITIDEAGPRITRRCDDRLNSRVPLRDGPSGRGALEGRRRTQPLAWVASVVEVVGQAGYFVVPRLRYGPAAEKNSRTKPATTPVQPAAVALSKASVGTAPMTETTTMLAESHRKTSSLNAWAKGRKCAPTTKTTQTRTALGLSRTLPMIAAPSGIATTIAATAIP